MDQHVDNGFATVLDNFIDGDGVEYEQYQLHLPDGRDLKHIRRIPLAGKMNRDQYLALLEKYDTLNDPRMLLEAGQEKNYYEKQGVAR